MTREEASNILDDYDVNFDGHTAEEIAEAFEVAFRALEQESCEDAISRNDMLDVIGHGTIYTSEELQKIIKALPSVKPQEPKTGHWIYEKRKRLINETDEGAEYITDYWCKCSNCGGDFGYIKMKDAFCKYCGAKMIEPLERSDKG